MIGRVREAETRPHLAILSPLNRHPGKPHGGITPVVINLANAFAARRLRVDLLLFTRPQGALLPAEIDASIRMVSVGTAPKSVTALRLWRYLRRERPVVLLSAGWRANAIAAWSKRLPALPTRVWGTIHNTLSPGAQQHHRWKKWWRRVALSRSYRALDGLIAVSKGVAEDFARVTHFPLAGIHVVYNPIVKPELASLAQGEVGHPWFSGQGHPVILGVGRLTRQKDFPTLIRAFAAVRSSRPARLMILGEGEARPQLEALIRELGLQQEVALPGFVSNPFAYMQRAALLVLSSAWEGFGNVLAEALGLGLPVVATDCPSGPREILQDGRYGPLVSVGDVAALAEAMLQVLAAPLDKTTLQAAGERFSVAKSAQAYLELLGLAGETQKL